MNYKIFFSCILSCATGLIVEIHGQNRIWTNVKVSLNSYYVSPTGDDSNSGASPVDAWQTVRNVNDLDLNPGDRVFFEGGKTYDGSLSFDSLDSGTKLNPVVISSFGKGRATINSGRKTGAYVHNAGGFEIRNINFVGSGADDSEGENGIYFYNDLSDGTKLEHVRIDSVDVSGYRDAGIVIGSGQTSNCGFRNVRITNAESHDNGDKGISVSAHWPSKPGDRSHRDIYVGNSKAYDNLGIIGKDPHTGNGIIISGVDTALIEYCEAYNNGENNNGSKGGPIGIWAWEASHVIIQFCESHHNKTGEINRKDGGGFDLDGGCVNSVMQYNYSHDNYGAGYGIYQFSGASPFTNNVVRYNISENDGLIGGYGAITFWSTSSSGGIQNTKVYNNTLYVSPNTGGAGIIDFVGATSYIHDTEVYNNIIITAPGKTVLNIPNSSGGWAFRGNCYWTVDDQLSIGWDGTTYTSLETWREATGQEMLDSKNVGFSIDPKLTDPGNGKTIGDPTKLATHSAYQLQSNSPMIDAGLNLDDLFGIDSGLRDFYGATLPQFNGFDVGAHESEQISSAQDNK